MRAATVLALVVAAVCVAGVAGDDDRPGTLLLNMLIKNEAFHLERSLPKWAPLIDYWIIGVDDKNTDNSEEIIDKYLGHIPGKKVVVEFDGMGPTWTVLVKKGLELFPNATHGILSDADFTPTIKSIDKRQLKMGCSKHMYKIRSMDGGTVRNMDWIYRNIPGAKVERRTHQSLSVPEQPGQTVYQTLIDLEVQEYEGGYQDRTGNKSARYLQWLHKDLEEMPGDPRTIYYLGHAHIEQIGPTPAQDVRSTPPGPGAYHVHKALEFFQWRADIRFGYFEERWFAMLKAGEVCERYLADYECSIGMWTKAYELDPERVDALFYIGQHWRLAQRPPLAIKWLSDAVRVKYPPRSLFQWDYLYECLRHLELGRAFMQSSDLDLKTLKFIKKSLKQGETGCSSNEEVSEVRKYLTMVTRAVKTEKAKAKDSPPPPPPAAPPTPAPQSAKTEKREAGAADKRASGSRRPSAQDFAEALEPFTIWQGVYAEQLESLQGHAAVSPQTRKILQHIEALVGLLGDAAPTCESYTRLSQVYLDTFRMGMGELREALRQSEPNLWSDWLENNMRLWTLCREQ